MKKEIQVKPEQEVLALVTQITYSIVPAWYDCTYQNLKMDLILPKHREGHTKQPCLLFICGGAFAVTNGSIWMPELMYFARRGYTVATINYRLSNEAIYPAALIDVKSAIRFLKAHANDFCIDPSKIIVSGESAGGTLCSLAGTTAHIKEYDVGEHLEYDSSVAGVVDFYGLADLTATRSEDSKDPRIATWMMSAFLGAGYSDVVAKKASAINYVNVNTPPFMILHGTADELVDIHVQSDAFYDKLLENGIYCEYYRLTGSLHGADEFYQDSIKELILNFMNKITK